MPIDSRTSSEHGDNRNFETLRVSAGVHWSSDLVERREQIAQFVAAAWWSCSAALSLKREWMKGRDRESFERGTCLPRRMVCPSPPTPLRSYSRNDLVGSSLKAARCRLAPLGSRRSKRSIFAVHSEHAESVHSVALFSSRSGESSSCRSNWNFLPQQVGTDLALPRSNRKDSEARYYAYSVSGESIPQLHSFDPQKVLLDPYAKSIFFPPGFDRNLAMREGSNAGQRSFGSAV